MFPLASAPVAGHGLLVGRTLPRHNRAVIDPGETCLGRRRRAACYIVREPASSTKDRQARGKEPALGVRHDPHCQRRARAWERGGDTDTTRRTRKRKTTMSLNLASRTGRLRLITVTAVLAIA